MRVDFELILHDVVSDEKIAFALAAAYGVAVEFVEVKDMANPLPLQETTKVWCRKDSVPGEFSTFLLIFLCGIIESDFLATAAKVSQALGCDCLVPDDDSPVGSSMVLISGSAPPKKVELIDDEEEDEDTTYTIKRKTPY